MWLFIWIKFKMCYEASSTVHPDGIPLTPVVQFVIEESLIKVPVGATRFTQLVKQLLADMSVARHVI